MLHRLRQVNFVVSDLEHSAGLYETYLGMPVIHRYEPLMDRVAYFLPAKGPS